MNHERADALQCDLNSAGAGKDSRLSGLKMGGLLSESQGTWACNMQFFGKKSGLGFNLRPLLVSLYIPNIFIWEAMKCTVISHRLLSGKI